MELGKLLNVMRLAEEGGSRSLLMLTLTQGQNAMRVKRACPKTWKTDLQENVGCRKSTWHQRVAIARDFGEFLLPEIPPEHVNTLPSSLALLTQLTKGTDAQARAAWLDQIAGVSYADVKKLVAEAKGKEAHDCGPFEETKAWKCTTCGKVRTKTPDGDS